MANNLVSVRLSKNLEDECKKLSKDLGYSSIQEFMREALRDKIDACKKSIALYAIQNMPLQKGKPASKKELAEFAKKLYGNS